MHPAPNKGCLISIFRCWGGERWPGMTLRWRCDEAARRSKPREIRLPGRRSQAVGKNGLPTGVGAEQT